MKKSLFTFSTPVEFANFGCNTIAYLRPVQMSDVSDDSVDEDLFPAGTPLWGLFAADGHPLAIGDDKGDLMLDAEERELVTVHRH